MRGTLSEVGGMASATSRRKTVSDSMTVTPEERKQNPTLLHPERKRERFCYKTFINHVKHITDNIQFS